MTSRKHAPHPYWNRLWRAAYAWSSFQNVRETCDYILSQKIQPEDTIYYPLVAAICVLYVRPFKRSKGIEPLSMHQFVPKKFQKLHKLLESLRDETVAHTDTGSFAFKGLPANHVRLIIRERGVLLEPHGVKFKLSLISEIRELVSALEKRMHEHSNKIVSDYQNDAPDDGEYLIDLTAGSLQPCTFTKSA
jgi:hypothetical protein